MSASLLFFAVFSIQHSWCLVVTLEKNPSRIVVFAMVAVTKLTLSLLLCLMMIYVPTTIATSGKGAADAPEPCATEAHLAFWQPEPTHEPCSELCLATLAQWHDVKKIWQGTPRVSFGNYLGREGKDLRAILIDHLKKQGEALDGEAHLTLHYSEVGDTHAHAETPSRDFA